MERHQRLDKLPQAEVIGMPHRYDGVGHALRQTFAPMSDNKDIFRGLLETLDQKCVNRERGD